MKPLRVAGTLFVQFILTTTAMAVQTVDFTALGANPVDITTATNPGGLTLNGVAFMYDDLGSAADTAAVSSSGISGSTFGALSFTLISPATQLNFDFSLLGSSGLAEDGVTMTFTNGGADVADLTVPANSLQGGNANGSVAYNGAAFDQVTMLFSLNAPSFTVRNVSYEPVPTGGGGVTNVDFTALGQDFVDITLATNPFGLTLNGLNFTYDDVGVAGDTAIVSADGVSGSTGGALIFTFGSPVSQLNFDFELQELLGPPGDGVTMTFTKGGANVANLVVPATAFVPEEPGATLGVDGSGTAAYNGAAFDQVTLLFSLDASSFTLSRLSYGSGPSAVPLAATVTSTPASGQAPLAVSLAAAATGGSGTYTYAWTSNPAVTFSAPNAASTTTTLAAAGTYTITCTVGDGSTSATGSTTVTVSASAAPPAVGETQTPANGQTPATDTTAQQDQNSDGQTTAPPAGLCGSGLSQMVLMNALSLFVLRSRRWR